MIVPPALHALYEDRHPLIAVRKPTQVGATEYCLNASLWAADTRVGERGNVLYLLPTAELAERTSQLRMNRAISESPYLTQRAQPDRGVAPQPASVRRRHIGEGIVVFAGAEQQSQYLGFDADLVILDEFDAMHEEVFSLAQQRLRSSRSPQLIAVSTPSVPEAGISDLFQMSNQLHYELLCANCDRWQVPEYPASVDQDALTVVCHNCRAALGPRQPGRWRATRPDVVDLRGYQLSRLVLPDPPLGSMRLTWEGKVPGNLVDFQRWDLGQPFSTSEARLSADILEQCAGVYPPLLRINEPLRAVAMGVDVGRFLHVVVRGLFLGRWYLLDASTCASFEELDRYFDRYRVRACVVDSLPEAREAKRFAQRHVGYVWLSRYAPRSVEPEWSYSPDWMVTSSRTAMIDETFARFREGRNRLPNSYQELGERQYVRHLLSPFRVEEKDGVGGIKVTYKGRGADDFAQAEVYATLAALKLEALGVTGQRSDFVNF